MENGDKPINTIRHNNGDLYTLACGDGSNEAWLEQADALIGYTKREDIARSNMAALLANPEWMATFEEGKYLMMKETAASVAVEYADALLAELDKA